MPSSSAPKLSIGLPVYNGQRYLAGTLDSLLGQSFTDFELIITDNASTDATEEISRAYASRDERIRYHRSEYNRGAAWNFNRAFHLACGKYFKWAAHDDLYHPLFLERCIEVLDHRPSVVLCFTGTDFIDAHGVNLGEHKFPIDLSVATRRQVFLFYACGGHIVHEIFGVFCAERLRRTPLIGPYVGSDLVLLATLALLGDFHQVPEQLFLHREHPDRSALLNKGVQGVQGYTQWFDTSQDGRSAMPGWRRMSENVKTVVSSRLSRREKLSCLGDIARAANWNRQLLFYELRRALSHLG